jgi:phosphatidylserine/phosphatidylglycerophosphate/cardiolipin synthase-like enzyme
LTAGGPFLAEAGGTDPPFPPRPGCRVTPLIEAAEMYPRLEEAMLEATESVWLGFRVFDPGTRLRSEAARERGFERWSELIEATVKRGVEVRLLLTDFEPVLADNLHADSWNSFRQFRRLRENLAENEQARLQILVIQHEGEIGWGWRQLFRLGLRWRLRRLIEKLLGRMGEEEHVFDVRPGLWRWLAWKGKRPHRWKCAIVDACTAFIGGLDLDERRWDDSGHDRQADETWHDISARVDGQAAHDAACHFADLWNRELPRFAEIVAEWTAGAERTLNPEPLTGLDISAYREEVKEAGVATVQLVRTRSRKSHALFAMGPTPHIREIRAAHRAIFAGARQRLYIEAQFFRSQTAADWIIEALRRNPVLEVIVLIANVPEEIAFLGEGDNPAHRHGEYLQARALSRIARAGGPERVGLFTLVRDERANGDEKEYEETRGTAFGSGIIYIHAKLVIADSGVCLLSSANINGRSFDWDTELGFLWAEEGKAIGRFRGDLWRRLSDGALDGDAGLADWQQLASMNSNAASGERKGFIVPYQLGRARRFGSRYFWVPDSLV